ncbi:hypothetical protein [Sedimentibacter sp.]|uniref:hypothetical protein n=1 Tax=Sedimentibacter sp. TaxID=1960295 RepID=UPI002896B132|nr:hypothetical protein [Sedimentibacter sp.]
MRKKSFLFLLIGALLFMPIMANAETFDQTDFSESTMMSGYIVSELDRQKDFENQLNEIIEKIKLEDSLIHPNAGDHIYTSEIVQTEYSIVEGFAGGQLPGGYQFTDPGGGIVFYDPSGGPKVSSSVSFDIPIKILTLSLGLGNANESIVGVGVPIPQSTTKYYKVWAKNTYKTNQVNIYKQITQNSPKILDSISYITTLYRTSQSVKVVPNP